jgi:hypothetical protein
MKVDHFLHYAREYFKDITEVTMTVLKKKPETTKCIQHRANSLIAHTAKESKEDT